MPSARRVVAYLINAAIALLVLFCLAMLFPMKFPSGIAGMGMLALRAAGRGGFCDAGAARGAWDQLMRLARENEQYLATATKVREDGNLTLWQTKSGPFWVPSRDKSVFIGLLAEQEMRVYGKVHPGDVVLDAGANIGDFTRSALSDGAKLVVAIEIAPDTLEALRRNLAAEISQGRVIVYTRGVWDSDTELTLRSSVDRSSGIDTVVADDEARVEAGKVKLTTIDKIAEELKLERIDLIKLDVEGAEIRGVLGARKVIRRFKPRIAFDSETFSESDVATLRRELTALDGRYRMIPGPCIFDYPERSLRTLVMRFEIEP